MLLSLGIKIVHYTKGSAPSPLPFSGTCVSGTILRNNSGVKVSHFSSQVTSILGLRLITV